MSELPDVVDNLIQRVEGGFQADPDDPGNWTGGKVGEGQLVGTKYGISAAANPDIDIPNLTWERAEDLYYTRYWLPSGAGDAWANGHKAVALVTMDGALHSGVSRGRSWIEHAAGNPFPAVALRLKYLADLKVLWPRYGRGWTRRVASVMLEAAELQAFDTPVKPSQPADWTVARVATLRDDRGAFTRFIAAFMGASGPVTVEREGDTLIVTQA